MCKKIGFIIVLVILILITNINAVQAKKFFGTDRDIDVTELKKEIKKISNQAKANEKTYQPSDDIDFFLKQLGLSNDSKVLDELKETFTSDEIEQIRTIVNYYGSQIYINDANEQAKNKALGRLDAAKDGVSSGDASELQEDLENEYEEYQKNPGSYFDKYENDKGKIEKNKLEQLQNLDKKLDNYKNTNDTAYHKMVSWHNKIKDKIASNGGNTDWDTVSGDNGDEREYEAHIYQMPDREDETRNTASDINDMITGGDEFLSKANNSQGAVNIAGLQDFSNAFYNILFAIGIVASVIVGMILGIKLMLASPEGKAELKQYILPYIIGCVVIFAGFGIWKLVVTILANV